MSTPATSLAEDHLIRLISPPRWRPYREHSSLVGGDPISAYIHNLDVSAALLRLIAIGEIVLRNALDKQLHESFGSNVHWADSLDKILTPRALNDIRLARRRARQAPGRLTPGQVTAQLNLGFWTYLLSKPYKDTLWIPALRHAFPHLRPQVRDVAYKQARRMLELRNRVAHHEEVFTRRPEVEAVGVLELLSWIDPAAADWAAHVCQSDIPGLRLPESRWSA